MKELMAVWALKVLKGGSMHGQYGGAAQGKLQCNSGLREHWKG